MQKTYALFDFDGTLIRGDSILHFTRYAYRQGLIGTREWLTLLGTGILYGLRLRTAVAAKERVMRFLAGKREQEVAAIAESFCQAELIPRLRPEGLAEIAAHRAQGHVVLLISASSTFYLNRLRQTLGVDDVIGTRFDVTPDGVFTGRVCGDNCRGVQKPLRLAEYLAAKGDRLDYDTSSAYGDSLGDLSMLRLCAHPVAVNPKPRLWRALRAQAGVRRVRWAEPAPRAQANTAGVPTA